jgi:hypothetical protein
MGKKGVHLPLGGLLVSGGERSRKGSRLGDDP